MSERQSAELERVLACPMDRENGARATTVREYLVALLAALWAEGEGFSGKRPFGNSGWEYEVYAALAEQGLIEGVVFDGDGYVEDFPDEARREADRLVFDAIQSLAQSDGDADASS